MQSCMTGCDAIWMKLISYTVDEEQQTCGVLNWISVYLLYARVTAAPHSQSWVSDCAFDSSAVRWVQGSAAASAERTAAPCRSKQRQNHLLFIDTTSFKMQSLCSGTYAWISLDKSPGAAALGAAGAAPGGGAAPPPPPAPPPPSPPYAPDIIPDILEDGTGS